LAISPLEGGVNRALYFEIEYLNLTFVHPINIHTL
jgi:hypothetical protein